MTAQSPASEKPYIWFDEYSDLKAAEVERIYRYRNIEPEPEQPWHLLESTSTSQRRANPKTIERRRKANRAARKARRA